MDAAESQNQIHEFISKFHSPITDFQTLVSLLCAPLGLLGLLPAQYYHLSSTSAFGLESSSLNLIPRKHLPQIQRALLTDILPTWYPILKENNAIQLVEQYFCPDSICNARPIAGEVALLAYPTLISLTLLTEQATTLLEKLVVHYPIDRLFRAVFEGENNKTVRKTVQWEDCVRDLCSIPVKVANAFGGQAPRLLENAVYFNALSLRTETLIFSLSRNSAELSEISTAVCYLINKLVNIGIFPPRRPTSRSQPSFFLSTLPHIQLHIYSKPINKYYRDLWSSILLQLPIVTLQSVLSSFFSSLLDSIQQSFALDDAPSTRALIKREAEILEGVTGRMTPSSTREEFWEVATGVILNMSKDWTESHARLFVCWTSGGGTDFNALETFLDKILETWASSEHIKHSLLSRHKYTTSLFLLTLSYLPPSSSAIRKLILNPSFIGSITTYISHMDTSVRRCGMLVAEEAARLTGKKLEFGGWESEGGILDWARGIRRVMKARDVDADLKVLQDEEGEWVAAKYEIIATSVLENPLSGNAPNLSAESAPTRPSQNTDAYDSDDSLTGYASPASSRSPSPSLEDLKEIEKDPTLNVGVKKLQRPVYLAQLGEFLRGQPGMQAQKPDEPHEADRIEMTLNVAEELIRRKRAYGTELDENAVNLVCGFLGLQDKYELEEFSGKRQGIVNALVACAPRKAAPVLVEEFFKNQYSTDQRFVALNALAIGARELSSLPVPPSLVPSGRTVFPSRLLPSPLHEKYITAGREWGDVLPLLMDELSVTAVSKEREAVERHPELVRQRRLRTQQPVRITEVAPHEPLNSLSQVSKPHLVRPSVKFIDVAAEYFIVPLINRFWAFLRDEQAREERTSFRTGRDRYRGAGTGMILNPVVLAQYLRTLGILVHASQNAPEWLSIIAPDALDLSVTIGTMPIPHLEADDDEIAEPIQERGHREASVLTSGLEVALIVLDSALEIDGGKILSLEHTTLVLAVGEWAAKVFASLEKGLRVPGGGGVHEAKLSRAAAGVLLKVDELSSKWGRSMLDTR